MLVLDGLGSGGNTPRLVKIDRATGTESILSFAQGTFNDPHGMATSPNRSEFFLTDHTGIAGGVVLKWFDNSGSSTLQLVNFGGNLYFPTALTFGPTDGQLYIVDDESLSGSGIPKIVRVDPSGFGSTTNIAVYVFTGTAATHAIAIAPGGSIYVLVGTSNRSILRIDPVTSTQSTLVASVGTATGLAYAAGFLYTVDPNGSNPGIIAKWDAATGTPVGAGYLSSGGNLVDPTAITFASDNFLYVADRNAFNGQGAIFRIDPITGAQVTISAPGSFLNPTAIAAK